MVFKSLVCVCTPSNNSDAIVEAAMNSLSEIWESADGSGGEKRLEAANDSYLFGRRGDVSARDERRVATIAVSVLRSPTVLGPYCTRTNHRLACIFGTPLMRCRSP